MIEEKNTQTMAKEKAKNQTSKTLINFKKPQINFAIAGLLFVIIFVLIAFPKYSEFQQLKADLQQVTNEINGNNKQGDFLGLKGQEKKLQNEYDETKNAIDKSNSEKQDKLDFVFPDNEKINFITKLLERYAIDHHSSNNVFELNSINFSKKQTLKGTKEQPLKPTPVNYEYLQINLPISASPQNFQEFIKFIQNSGSLDSQDFYGGEIPVPLMTIESLNFSYAEDKNNPEKELVNANFILNTYIRKNVSSPE